MKKVIQSVKKGSTIKMGRNQYKVLDIKVISSIFDDSKVNVTYSTMKSGVIRNEDFAPGFEVEVIS